MHKIDFTQDIKFGDDTIDAISVKGLTFIELSTMWANPTITTKGMQRARIAEQTHFMSAGKRVIPDAGQISQLPAGVAKTILAHLDLDNGPAGKVVSKDTDGATKPILYQLGTPIEMVRGKETLAITELEFMATTFGELESVFAHDTAGARALALIRDIAVPVGTVESLSRLPGWALDKLTVGDGVTIMNKVSPAF